ncbi:hypothetical protein O6H91_19G020300 [Diphasiastrum complanatum]|uniref:Uncharacterized protein n=1 Tax=Diphasiastrum complanatum TaxID=34168 RepID=A0ACC2AT91_DIPCM|nr:hypothetical protein O6H91_19G020300 [Diphasiastrum complanatum]
MAGPAAITRISSSATPIISQTSESRRWKLNDLKANKDGYRHKMYWVTGDVYLGEWKLNKRDGVGIHTYKNGSRYEGEFKKGKREGHGTLFVAHGNKYRVVYKGYWSAGAWNGLGILFGKFGETYEGQFQDGLRHGYGRQTYWCLETKNYHIYVGDWQNDKHEGLGTLTMVNGDTYIGSFSKNLKEGKGCFLFADKKSKYEGTWKADVPICGAYVKLDDNDLYCDAT